MDERLGDGAKPATPGGLEEQLTALYRERELLEEELGRADAGGIIAMVKSLEAQLQALYSERLRAAHPDP